MVRSQDSRFTSRQQEMLLDLLSILSQPGPLNQTVKDAHFVLRRLIPADGFVVCTLTPTESDPTYSWVAADLPQTLFAAYSEVAEHDFVRNSVVAAPSQVLREHQMIDRRRLSDNVLYQRCRAAGFPLEHVMSVLLPTERNWHGGVTFYRASRGAFSKCEAMILARACPGFSNLLRVHRLCEDTGRQSLLLDEVLRQGGVEAILLEGRREELRTAGVAELLLRWFSPAEQGKGLPMPLREMLAQAEHALQPEPLRRTRGDCILEVTLIQHTASLRRCFIFLLRESNLVQPLSRAWVQRLTP